MRSQNQYDPYYDHRALHSSPQKRTTKIKFPFAFKGVEAAPKAWTTAIRMDERKRCAMIVEELGKYYGDRAIGDATVKTVRAIIDTIATAIRRKPAGE
jgi:hypothetical protein